MKRKLMTLCSIVMFIAGFFLLLYPSITKYYANYQTDKIINEFKEDIKKLQNNNAGNSSSDKESEENTEESKENVNSLDRLYKDMILYNETIYNEGQKDLKDPFSYETPSFDLKKYGFSNDVIGILIIPAMQVSMPLYLGADKSNMTKGAAVLGQTSMPIGGINTNSVIAAHRGYKGIKMFRDIEKIKPGDEICIETPWDTLYYSVTHIKIVNPDKTDEIYIQSGEDMITLVTCHPYTKNTYRYLVYAKRCEDSVIISDNIDNNLDNNESENGEYIGNDNKYTTNENIKVIDEGVEKINNNSSKIIWFETYMPYIGGIVVFIIAVICMILNRRNGD